MNSRKVCYTETYKRFINDVIKVDIPTRREELNLAKRACTGDIVAIKKLAHVNQRLVINIAVRYARMNDSELVDIIQDGNVGLMKAISKFDPDKGYRFSTYATWWIMQAIKRGLANTQRMIRLPVPLHEQGTKLLKIARKFENLTGKFPTHKKLAEEACMDVAVVSDVMNILPKQVISLDEEISEGLFFYDLLPNATTVSAEDVTQQNGIDERVVAFVEKALSQNEAYVILGIYGIGRKRPATLKQLGIELGLHKSRIGQLSKSGKQKLSLRKQLLKEYING